jgi:hypothetical protein
VQPKSQRRQPGAEPGQARDKPSAQGTQHDYDGCGHVLSGSVPGLIRPSKTNIGSTYHPFTPVAISATTIVFPFNLTAAERGCCESGFPAAMIEPNTLSYR